MKLPDVNVLLNAKNSESDHHDRARDWLGSALSGGPAVALTWTTLLGFVRISTNGLIFPNPLSATAAMDAIGEWLDEPNATIVTPTRRHADLLRSLLEQSGTAGNLTTDAHLATLAIEHGATLTTFDGDFHRFEKHGLRLEYLG